MLMQAITVRIKQPLFNGLNNATNHKTKHKENPENRVGGFGVFDCFEIIRIISLRT